MDAVETRQLTANSGAMQVTYLGVSTLLIDDGETQVMIDGYLSRPDKPPLSRLAPSRQTIEDWINDEGIRSHYCAEPNLDAECPPTARRGLSLIVAAHGHYDHALDTPTVAALTGSWLVSDAWMDEIIRASREYFVDSVPAAAWDTLRERELDYSPEDTLQPRYTAGKFSVTLIPTVHVDYPGVELLRGSPDTRLSFPTRALAMKEGNSLSIHVTHPAGSMLIVPTFGVPEAAAADLRADVVFLGIGFAGWLGVHQRIEVWQGSVGRSGARRAVLTHWDDLKGPIPTSGGNLRPFWVLRLDQSWRTFCALAGDGVDLRFAPAGTAIDPFASDTAPGQCG